MKPLCFATLLAVLCISEKSSALPGGDSSSIYVTKKQFDSDSGEYSCKCRVQYKAPLFWSEFFYNADGKVRIKEAKKEPRVFEPGSIYGFSINGIKFMFIASENRYLAVLGSKSSVSFFVDHNYKTTFVSYLNPQDGKLRVLRRKNLETDFKAEPNLLPKLLLLNKKLADYYWVSSFNRKDFFTCKKIISETEL